MVGILQKCNTRNISGKGVVALRPDLRKWSPGCRAESRPGGRRKPKAWQKRRIICRMVAHAGALIGVDFLNEIDPR
jgi:hypothetical protein